MQHKHLGLGLAEQAHTEQRAAVPAFAALVDQQDELLFRAFGVESVEFADVVVGSDLAVAHVHQDARGRDAVLEQRTLDGGLQLFRQLLHGGCKEGQLRGKPFGS
ncbi:hypothetical protein SDC9_104490 [bioreactor metagenome]|uniref:Uncharacterized protein n=1 Tax=bioreactor metagenome TaxID=1076179 RepID=A0A645AWY5_9ZZZZ